MASGGSARALAIAAAGGASSLVASLAHRSPGQDGTYRIQISQGVAMGRPSTLDGTAHKTGGRLSEVVVAGRATILGNGTMTLPAR